MAPRFSSSFSVSFPPLVDARDSAGLDVDPDPSKHLASLDNLEFDVARRTESTRCLSGTCPACSPDGASLCWNSLASSPVSGMSPPPFPVLDLKDLAPPPLPHAGHSLFD
ncbi:hypothetical protein FRX31_018046 [Thalictrum thalictroides]|uniref:Uncharacterized protein n=1 Tax=Thalictrum thalictroides TaxID=46969 RepID=A0A7J6W620_THATH|nr:hypothetical protein FRX31_018046 [Thalictrum thalictroides]